MTSSSSDTPVALPQPAHSLSGQDVLAALNVEINTGLTTNEANNRLQHFGPNVLPAKQTATVWERLWAQINSVLIYILLIGAIVSFVFNHMADAVVIIGVIVVNITVGFFMEGKAESTTASLKKMMNPTAIVLRDEEKVTIESSQLTMGDIVFLQSGDVVPADARVLQATDLTVLEAALTGESHAILKEANKICTGDTPLAERACIVYAGTQVLKGTATVVTIGVGGNCEIGKISGLLTEVVEHKTPLQLQLEVFGRWLSVAIIIVALAGLAAALGRHYHVDDAFAFAIGIAVAAIPEGLPSCVTITFAVGVYKMAKKGAIIKSLPAVETLGSVSVICSDKTGTLTMNKMVLKAIGTGSSHYQVSDDGHVVDATADPATASPKFTTDETLALILPGVLCNDSTIVLEGAATQNGHGNGESSGIEMSPSKASVNSIDVDLEQVKDGGNYTVNGDPTETSITNLAAKLLGGPSLKQLLKSNPRLAEIPFDSATKFMAAMFSLTPTLRKHLKIPENEATAGMMNVIFVKGAPEKVVSFTTIPDAQSSPQQAWFDQAMDLASQGMRVLGCAYKVVSPDTDLSAQVNSDGKLEGFTMSCLVGIMDPPRPEAIAAVAKAQKAGIVVKMITGDHPVTAAAIGKTLGLRVEGRTRSRSKSRSRTGSGGVTTSRSVGDRSASQMSFRSGESDSEVDAHPTRTGAAVTGAELDEWIASNNITMFDKAIVENDIFARTSPEHKLRIVQSLQRQGITCSMTGDGVNDAPALKQANIGVAMGITGTEVAKEASNMILTDDNFATIVDTVRMGRCTYNNLIKILAFVLPTNGGQAFSIIMALIIGVEVPITALQILWVNMITSITLGMVFAFEPPNDSLMLLPPRRPNKAIFGKFLMWRLVFVTILLVIAVLGIFQWEKQRHGEDGAGEQMSVHKLRTIAVNMLSTAQAAYLFNCRALKDNLTWKQFCEGNAMILVGLIAVAMFQAIFTYAPPFQYIFHTEAIDGESWGKIFLLSFGVFVVVEIEKFLRKQLKTNPWIKEYLYEPVINLFCYNGRGRHRTLSTGSLPRHHASGSMNEEEVVEGEAAAMQGAFEEL